MMKKKVGMKTKKKTGCHEDEGEGTGPGLLCKPLFCEEKKYRQFWKTKNQKNKGSKQKKNQTQVH